MKEHPIIFSTPMVQAILLGRKTQMRRILKFNWIKLDELENNKWLKCGGVYDASIDEGGWGCIQDFETEDKQWMNMAKYSGMIGDMLWVRETFCPTKGTFPPEILFKANEWSGDPYKVRWKPSIHMPRLQARIFLEIINIRVERLNNITENDAISEGISEPIDGSALHERDFKICPECGGFGLHGALGEGLGYMEVDCTTCDSYKKRFRILWKNINDKNILYEDGKELIDSWDLNPWVWVIEFKIKNG